MDVAGGTWPNFQILGPLNNFWMNRAIRFKFGADIEDGLLRRVYHKTTLKWAWRGSRDPISKFWDPHITGKTWKVNCMYINNNKTANIKGKKIKFAMTCKVDYTYITQLKLQKKIKRWYYTALHWHSGDVLQSNITFFFFFFLFAVLVVWYTYSRPYTSL